MRRFMGVGLAIVLIFSPVFNVKADNITESEKKLNQVNSSIKEKKQKIDVINKSKEELNSQLKNIDSQLSSTTKTLAELNEKIGSINSKVKDTEKQLKVKEAELLKERIAFKERARVMYINGSTAYLEILLSADDFSDLIGRVECIKTIMDYDNKLIVNMEKNKKIVETKKNEYETQRKQAVTLKQKHDDEAKVLQVKASEKKNIMSVLEKDKSSYEKMVAEEEAQSGNIAAMIKKMKQQQSNNNVQQGVRPSTGKYSCVTGSGYGITSPYGWRIHPVLGTKRFHSGIDIGVPMGTSVYALSDGVVVYSGEMSGYGNVVMINHGNIISLYAHNSALLVSEGQAVKGGQRITYSGNTGLSSGPHLHFEIRQASSGDTIDPNGYYVR